MPFSNYQMRVHEPLKTVAICTASTLASCVILCLNYFVAFSSFAHQTARESAEIVCQHGFCRSEMVITSKYHYPKNKPTPLFCPILAYTKGRGAYLRDSTVLQSLSYLYYRAYSNRTQAKEIISNLVCTQLESKQFQEVNFLALIRCCIVIEQTAQLWATMNSWYIDGIVPGPLAPIITRVAWERPSDSRMVSNATESRS